MRNESDNTGEQAYMRQPGSCCIANALIEKQVTAAKMRVSLIRSRIERMQKAKVLSGPVISFIIAEKRERPVHGSVGVSGATRELVQRVAHPL